RFWDFLWGVIRPEDLDADEREQIRRFMEEGEAEHARCMEKHPAGRIYRQELTRLALPQPSTLAGIDVIGEAIRVAGIPFPGPKNGADGQRADWGQDLVPTNDERN